MKGKTTARKAKKARTHHTKGQKGHTKQHKRPCGHVDFLSSYTLKYRNFDILHERI